jgi:hypothetical protein
MHSVCLRRGVETKDFGREGKNYKIVWQVSSESLYFPLMASLV